jgi:hypothetical protein
MLFFECFGVSLLPFFYLTHADLFSLNLVNPPASLKASYIATPSLSSGGDRPLGEDFHFGVFGDFITGGYKLLVVKN